MSEAKPPGPDADKLARQLQDSLAKRRPTTWKPVLVVIGLCTLVLVLFAWWLKPRPSLPLLPLVAMDTVYTLDETPQARIQLYVAADDADVAHRLRGQDVLFQGQGLEFVHEGRKSSMVRVKSDGKGQAIAELPKSPEPAVMDFQARHIDDSRGLKGAAPDSGQVFVWPKDARLLIVDFDETLTAKELDVKAAATLKKAAEADWRIVYLSLAGAQADQFQQARDWLREQAEMPPGPVLGRSQYPSEESAAQARGELLRSLNVRFSGSKNVVVKTAEAAALCKELGLRTIVVGDAITPSWAEVFDQLK
jgi:hypothetical protein